MILKKIPSLALSLIQKNAISCLVSEYPKEMDNTFRQKAIRVAVLGADTHTGEMVAFLLKQNPIVSQIYLYGEIRVLGLAAELRHLDTRSEVKGYCGKDGLNKSLRRADIVLLIGMDKNPISASAEDRLRTEMDKLVTYADACTKYAPKSLITVCTRPVSATMPIVSDIFRSTHWYHPGRIIGCAALVQTRINSYVGHFHGLDPKCVHVPIIGGPDHDNVVPLFSRATPINVLRKDVTTLKNILKNWKEDSTKECKSSLKIAVSSLSEAYAINQLVTTMGLGLCGDDYAVATAFVRQNIIDHCRYLVTTVKFGPCGIVHNYGVPVLSKVELHAFEKAVTQLNEREEMALKVFALTCAMPEPNRLDRMWAKAYVHMR